MKLLIGELIRIIREKRNFTQQYVADELELTQKGYSRIETGEVKITLERFISITEILKVDAVSVFQIFIEIQYDNDYSKIQNLQLKDNKLVFYSI